MDLKRGVLARIDRKLLAGLEQNETYRMVRVPVTAAKWSTWKRYCESAGISMGRAIVTLIDRELVSVFGDHTGDYLPDMGGVGMWCRSEVDKKSVANPSEFMHDVVEGAFSFPEVRAGHQEGVVMRRLALLLSLLLAVVGCSSGSDSGDIAFEHVFDMPTETSVWTATGEAIDNDLLCPAATGAIQGFEDADGAVQMPPDIGALYEAGDPFVNVSVEAMTCDDGSGEFTLRLINEIDPSITDGVPVVASSWTITGGTGYDTTSGNGDNELPQQEGESSVATGTGTITTE